MQSSGTQVVHYTIEEDVLVKVRLREGKDLGSEGSYK
jgi:hypothetical protein